MIKPKIYPWYMNHHMVAKLAAELYVSRYGRRTIANARLVHRCFRAAETFYLVSQDIKENGNG